VRTPLSWMEKVVGLFVVFIGGLFVLALFVTAQRQNVFNLRQPFEVYTFLDEGYELVSGAKVKISNIEAGIVTDVRLVSEKERDPNHFDRMVRVTIRVEGDNPNFLSYRTIARIKRKPIGGTEVELVSETKDLVVAKLKPKTNIESDVPPDLFEQLAGIKTDVEAVKDDVLKTLRDLQGIIANVRATTDAIVGRAIHDPKMADDIAASIAGAREVVAELKAVAANARSASEPIPEATAEARDLVKDLRATAKKADGAIAPLPEVIASVERALRDVEVLVRNLKDASGGLPEVVRKTDRGLEETNRTIEAAQRSFLLRGSLPERPAPVTEVEALPRGGADR
jgi:ABC-type transporter Mla subunit MlaD